MDLTFTTCRLLFPKFAFESSLTGIGIELFTAFTEFITAMMVSTVYLNHDADCLDFLIYWLHHGYLIYDAVIFRPHQLIGALQRRPG